MKIVGSPWKEGEIRREVDNVFRVNTNNGITVIIRILDTRIPIFKDFN